MKTNPSAVRLCCLCIAAELLLGFASTPHAEPRSPLPPWPEPNPISQLKWDAALSPMRDDSTTAVGVEGATLVESWSGYALQREGLSVVPVVPFVLPGVNEKGVANLGHRQGCVRFWFAPSWDSGKGQGQVARLAEWVVTDGREVGTLWALSVNEDGTVISLGSGGAEVLRTEIKWDAGGWHQVALSYSEKGTELVIDGERAATSAGLLAVEPKISGLVIGSDWKGLYVAGGMFDELLCFADPMSAEDVAFNYHALSRVAAMGPLTKAEMAMFSVPGSDAAGSTLSYRWSTNSPCPTNGPLMLTNVVCVIESNETVTVEMDVAGPDWTNGLPYDVFATTNLGGATTTNGAWWWVTNTFYCSTVVLSNQPWFTTLYILGTPQDSDGDGLTDAFENLVSATNPNNADTDGDGMSDGWEWEHGLNPLVAADAADDPDGDWLTNLLEYNGGTNSTNPHDLMVLAWGYEHDGQLIVPTSLRDVVQVAGGSDFSLALRSDGTVASWGYATNAFAGVGNAVQISAKWEQAAALRGDGTVATWGTTYGSPPADLTNAVMVGAGAGHVLALRSDGTVTAWGANNNQQCNVPTNLANVNAVAAGWHHSVALRDQGTVAAWGYAGPTNWAITTPPAGLSNVVAVASGGFHTLALKTDGTVVAWGAGATTNGNGSFLAAEWGQIVVPPGLSNVVAIEAGGYHSTALKSDGTVVVWGDMPAIPFADAQGHISGIGSGDEHSLALRSGRLTPLIVPEPTDQFALPGEAAQFTATGFGLADVYCQWQFNGVNITGATNSALAISNASTNHEGSYRVIVSTGAGSVFSSNAVFQLVSPPVIASQSMPTNLTLIYLTNVTLSVVATAPGQFTSFPLSYQWEHNGSNIAFATSSNYAFRVSEPGTYSVFVSNVAGGTSASWQVTITYDGSGFANIMARTNGSIGFNWAGFVYGQTNATGFTWLTNGFLTGLRGASAISPANELEGSTFPGTALTRRHVYIRGHGADGVLYTITTNLSFIGKKYWFIGTNNVAIPATIADNRVCYAANGEDWTILFLSSDLPAEVEPMRCIMDGTRTPTNAATPGNIWNKLPPLPPWPIFGTCQHNQLSGGDWGYSIFDNHDIHTPGDSGSPNMLLLTNEVVLLSGRATTGISSLLLSNLNAMTLSAGLSTNSYHPKFVDLSGWPDL